MKARKHQWITVLALGLTIVLVVACGAKETPAPAPTEAPAAPEAPAATEPPAATEEAAAPTAAPTATEAPAATEEAAATEAPAAPSGDEKSIIANSAASLKGLNSYRSKVTVETEEQTMEILYEIVLPDRFHMVSEFAELIVIGDDMYMKVGDDWMKMPGGEGMELTQFAEVAIEASDILEAQLEGTEDVEGVPCQKYVYTVTGEGQTFEATAWIGVEDGLPRKILTQTEGTTVTQILYDFNADITIEPPPGVE